MPRQTLKTTAIISLAVSETIVSRHHGSTIHGLHETPRTSQHYRIEGFSISSPLCLCQDTQVSRTVIHSIAVFFSSLCASTTPYDVLIYSIIF